MEFVTIGGYVLAFIAGIFGLRSKRGDVWKEEAEAYRAKAERLEADLSEFRVEFQDYKRDTSERIDRLEIENRRLAELASGHETLVALTETIQQNHVLVMAAIQAGQVIAAVHAA